MLQRGAACARQCLGTHHPSREKILIDSGSPQFGLKSQPGPGTSHLAFPSASNLQHLICLFFPALVAFGPCCLIGSWTSAGICALNAFKTLSPKKGCAGQSLPGQGGMGEHGVELVQKRGWWVKCCSPDGPHVLGWARGSRSTLGLGCAGRVSKGNFPCPAGIRSEPERTNKGELRNESGRAF